MKRGKGLTPTIVRMFGVRALGRIRGTGYGLKAALQTPRFIRLKCYKTSYFKGSDSAIGLFEIRLEDFKAELGYGLGKAFWGKGYTTEAARTVVDWALAQPSIYRVWAVCDVDNIGSRRVMEKIGMQREGILRREIIHPNISAEPRDCYLYSIIKD